MMLPMGIDAVDASHWAKNLPIDEIQLRGTYTGSKRCLLYTSFLYINKYGGRVYATNKMS